MAVNLFKFEKKFDEFKSSFMDELRAEINNIREEIRKEEIRKKEQETDEKLKQLEKIKLSKNNAKLFLKYIKILEELENTRKDTSIIASEYGADIDTVELLRNAVRYARIYEKFKEAKAQIVSYL